MRTLCALIIGLASAVVLASAHSTQAQAPNSIIARMPPDAADAARDFLSTRRSAQQRIDSAAEIAEDESPASLEFLIASLARETVPMVRQALVAFVGHRTDERVVAALEQVIKIETNAETIALANDHLSGLRARLAERDFSAAGLNPTDRVEDPKPEPVKVATSPIRFALLGDFGTCERGMVLQCPEGEKDPQNVVGRAMRRLHEAANGQQAFHFGLTLGDNFYEWGVKGVDDPRWKHDWEDRYPPLGIMFHATLGNHDHYGGRRSVEGQIEYTEKNKNWTMTARYRPLAVGDGKVIQLFIIDSHKLFESGSTQLNWLARMLKVAQSSAPTAWRIVAGHHPVVSGGDHGANKKDLGEYRSKLLPVLKEGGAHMYLSGHDHDMQLLKVEGLYQIVAGAAGKKKSVKKIQESTFCRKGYGFAVVEATNESLRVNFLSDQDPPKSVYSCTIQKDPTTGALSDNCAAKCK